MSIGNFLEKEKGQGYKLFLTIGIVKDGMMAGYYT